MSEVSVMNGVTVREHQRTLTLPLSQLPNVLAAVHLLGELSESNPKSGQRLLTAMWHTYRALDSGEVENGGNDEYVKGLSALFDFYFDHLGDWNAIERHLWKRAPAVNSFAHAYQTNLKVMREAAHKLDDVESRTIAEQHDAR